MYLCGIFKRGVIVMAKNKHLTDTERLQIEQWLKDHVSIIKIAINLGKSTSTISMEIRNRAVSSCTSYTYDS